jgi:hypothetical protein
MAEELALEKAFRQRGAVDLDKGSSLT